MIVDACSWDRPGADPYMGTTQAAIMAMVQIPEPTRRTLVAMADRKDRHLYATDHVVISRDAIEGDRFAWRSEIAYMSGGDKGRICKTVTRTKWNPNVQHRALVFCADGWCVAEPSVCRNWAVVYQMQQITLEVISKQTPASRNQMQASAPASGGTHTVPEPGSLFLALLAGGLAGLVRYFRRKK